MAEIKCVFMRIFGVLIAFFSLIQCDESEIMHMSRKLDSYLLGIKNERFFKDSERSSSIWQDYDFDSGIEGREELIVTKVDTKTDSLLFRETENYKFFVKNEIFYLAASAHSMFVLNVLDKKNLNVTKQYHILQSERIFTFEILNPFDDVASLQNNEDSQIIVILSVEGIYGRKLVAHMLNNEKFEEFWSWPLEAPVDRLYYFQYNDHHRLITVKQRSNNSRTASTYIDVYGFSLTSNLSDFWLSERLPDYEVLDLKTCSAYDGIMIALQLRDKIIIYNYHNDNSKEGHLEMFRTIESAGLKNFVCFQSGHILYLGTSGATAAVFDFYEGEFGLNSIFNVTIKDQIEWIEIIPVNTYRDEVLVLLQLKNSSIITLGWNGRGFQIIPSPSLDKANLNLSKITVIPKIGFVYENQIVKIETTLRELPRSLHNDVEILLRLKYELTDIMQKQQLIFQETERRIQTSYLRNSFITGHWRVKTLKSKNVIIEKGVDYKNLLLGGKNTTMDEIESCLIQSNLLLEKFQATLKEIRTRRENALPSNAGDIKFDGDVEITGDLMIQGTANIENLMATSVNNVSIAEILHDYLDYQHNAPIHGQKTFPSIKAEKLDVRSINGIPIEKIVFDEKETTYNEYKLLNIKKLVIEGNLNFTSINGRNWQTLLKSVVLKSKPTKISGKTIIKGSMTTNYLNPKMFNGHKYPDDFIMRTDTDSIEMPSLKYFKKVAVNNLHGVWTLNGSSINDYILLHSNQTLKKITFENLEITGRTQIDGTITGCPVNRESFGLLNETHKILSKVIFANVIVNGKMLINESINNKTWPMFDDLISKEKVVAEVTGKKTFSGLVVIAPSVNITSNKINKHDVTEFATIDTNQNFSRLTSINASVTFGKLMRGELDNLKEIFKTAEEDGVPKCINKILTFQIPPIIDELSVDTFNNNISAVTLKIQLNETLSNFVYKNINVETLYASSLTAENVNGMKYEDFLNRRISKTKKQSLTGNYEIQNLDATMLHAETINGKSVNELKELQTNLDDLYEKIVCGNITINHLSVIGLINATSFNNNSLSALYNSEGATVIFESDVSIGNLEMDGLMNLKNLSDIVNDAVLKTDTNISVFGRKNISQIICEILEVSEWNQHSVHRFLNPSIPQTLTGPVTVKGTTIVKTNFNINKKINNVTLKQLKSTFDYVTNTLFVLNGNFEFRPDDVSIDNLSIIGTIQNTNFNIFYESLIFLNSRKISVTNPIVIKNTVMFNNLTITNRLNDINLKEFHEKVVLIDRPFSINAKVISTENFSIDGNLLLTEEMEVKTVMDVDMNDLLDNALYLHRPIFVPGTMTFEKVLFTSDIVVQYLNNYPMNRLIALHKNKTISGILRARDVTVGKVDLQGTLNGQDLAAVYKNTFQLTGDQNVFGNLLFSTDVNIRRDFDVRKINGINPLDFVVLEDNETLTGDFTFENDATLNGSLRILGRYNGIDCLTWQAMAVKTTFPDKQIVSGQWTIQGDVHLKGNVGGSGLLNGTNVKGLISNLQRRYSNLHSLIDNNAESLRGICEDVKILKTHAETQLRKFKFFDYLQIFDFDSRISSIYHFESDDIDYLFINLENCQLNGYVFIKGTFIQRGIVENFGVVRQWIILDYKSEKYFVTVGANLCNRSSGNIWKLTDNEFVQVMDLGNITDSRKINDREFLVLTSGGSILRYSIEDIYQESQEPRKSYFIGSEDVKFMANSFEVLLLDNTNMYRFDPHFDNFTLGDNVFGTRQVTGFEVGVRHKRLFAYYDPITSEDYLFVSDGRNGSSNYIAQVIDVYRPSSVLVINFDDFVENLMIFIEDDRWIQVYEYKGVEGFAYLETLQIEAEDLLAFKVRKHLKFVKAHCLGVIRGNKFIILEASMYGERLEAEPLEC